MTRAFHAHARTTFRAAGAERELKFLAEGEAFDAALALPLLGGPDGGSSRRLESVYFDTGESDLARAGVALARPAGGRRLRSGPQAGGGFRPRRVRAGGTGSEVVLRRTRSRPVRRSDRSRSRKNRRRQGACRKVRLRRAADDEDDRVFGRGAGDRFRFRFPVRRRAARTGARNRGRAQGRPVGGAVRLRSRADRGASGQALRREQGRARAAPPVARAAGTVSREKPLSDGRNHP